MPFDRMSTGRHEHAASRLIAVCVIVGVFFGNAKQLRTHRVHGCGVGNVMLAGRRHAAYSEKCMYTVRRVSFRSCSKITCSLGFLSTAPRSGNSRGEARSGKENRQAIYEQLLKRGGFVFDRTSVRV